MDAVTDGCLDFVWQIPAGRKLEDRVLDLLRVWQVAVQYSGLEPDDVQFVATPAGEETDESMIASRLLDQGIFGGNPQAQQ